MNDNLNEIMNSFKTKYDYETKMDLPVEADDPLYLEFMKAMKPIEVGVEVLTGDIGQYLLQKIIGEKRSTMESLCLEINRAAHDLVTQSLLLWAVTEKMTNKYQSSPEVTLEDFGIELK